jgi:putative transcriptional regulator
MIRFRLQELLADKQFKEGRRVTLTELSQATGINRVTLSKMVNQRGYSTVTDNLDKLCKFFDCKVGDVAEFVPDEELKS